MRNARGLVTSSWPPLMYKEPCDYMGPTCRTHQGPQFNCVSKSVLPGEEPYSQVVGFPMGTSLGPSLWLAHNAFQNFQQK